MQYVSRLQSVYSVIYGANGYAEKQRSQVSIKNIKTCNVTTSHCALFKMRKLLCNRAFFYQAYFNK